MCGTIPLRAHVSFFQISYYSLAIILVSVSSSFITLAIPMREVFCVGYTPRAWDPRYLQAILDGPFRVFRGEMALLMIDAFLSIDRRVDHKTN